MTIVNCHALGSRLYFGRLVDTPEEPFQLYSERSRPSVECQIASAHFGRVRLDFLNTHPENDRFDSALASQLSHITIHHLTKTVRCLEEAIPMRENAIPT